MLAPANVVEVFRPGSFGSGYLVNKDLVLTAAHVVEGGRGAVEVRALEQEQWLPVEEVVWSGGKACDAAVLRIREQRVGEPVRLGRLATSEPARCEAVGFPLAQKKILEARRIRDAERIRGEIDPLAGSKEGLLTVHIGRSVPTPDASGRSPWEGMSGAALFSGPLLVGVIVVDPAHFGTDRLQALPVTAMAQAAVFSSTLGVPPSDLLHAVEDEPARAVVAPPFSPLPAQATSGFLRHSPVHMLYPQFGIVPFHGRHEELAKLATWLEGDGLAVALLFGRGGVGKTRLAGEICRAQESAGWLVGFIAEGAELETLATACSPLLLVIDEAQGRLDELAIVLRRFADHQRENPVRILLLARDPGDWWEHALPERLTGDPVAEIALAAARAGTGGLLLELGAVEGGGEGRRVAFQEATRAFARKTERSINGVPTPELDEELFGSVLFIHLAALTALEGGPVARGPLVDTELLRARLENEERYWATSARQQSLEALDGRVRRCAVALATLTTAETEAEAAAALLALPDLADEGEGVRRRVARWLMTLYPGEGFLRPLEPDLLGEALVGSVLADVPELAERLLAASTAAQAKRALAVLSRAARSHESAEKALAAVLREQLPSLWKTGIEVAQETGDPLGTLLAQALREDPRAGLAGQMLAEIPARTVALRELAAVAAQQALTRERPQPDGQDRILELSLGYDREAETARLAINLGVRLANLGRDEEALKASEDAVALCRSFTVDTSESRARSWRPPSAFLPDLAMALNNLSSQLAALDRHGEALTASDEAVALYRDLAEAQPDTFSPPLAGCLTNLSTQLAALERWDEALAAIEEAVAIFQGLAESQPDTIAPDLAGSLTNLSTRLAALERWEEALAAIEEAVDIYRSLAEARPDAFLPELGMALHNLSIRLSERDRPEKALKAIEESVGIYRSLAKARPDVFLSNLARGLDTLANRLDELDRSEEALAASEEALTSILLLSERKPPAPREPVLTMMERYVALSSELGYERDPDLTGRMLRALQSAGFDVRSADGE